MSDDLIEIHEHFIYSIKQADDPDQFIEHLLKEVIYDYEYTDDKKLNHFIVMILESYPILFSNIQKKKKESNKYNTLTKAKTVNKILKKIFIEEVNENNLNEAVHTLMKKKLFHINDNLIAEFNDIVITDFSESDLSKKLADDILFFTDPKKIKHKGLKKYLKKEILLRIVNINNIELYDEYHTYILEEKELILDELKQALKASQTAEDFWNSF